MTGVLTSGSLDLYLTQRAELGINAALSAAVMRLSSSSPSAWLALAQGMLQHGLAAEAQQLLTAAVDRNPRELGLVKLLAQKRLLSGDAAAAVELLVPLQAHHPTSQSLAWLLADAQRERGHYSASAATASRLALFAGLDTETRVRCIDWIRDRGREAVAMKVCRELLRQQPQNLYLRALEGQLALALGDFDIAHRSLSAAMDAGIDLNEWHLLLPLSMSRRYQSASDADFGRFRRALAPAGMRAPSRASALYGFAKLQSDIGDYAGAAQSLREANGIGRAAGMWSMRTWREFVKRRLARTTEPFPEEAAIDSSFVPIFIVGLPRSGTSLVAERLNREQGVRNRGESAWLPFIAEKFLSQQAEQRLVAAREIYIRYTRQDDPPAQFYLDKNPINFRYLDVIARLFPQARVIHCRRQLRDAAVSIYAQNFSDALNAYSHDFVFMADYADGTAKLMAHWRKTLPLPIFDCVYERLVREPEAVLAELRTFLGISVDAPRAAVGVDAVATASAWQARQPIHTASIGRWKTWAPHLPELLAAFPDADAVG